MNSELTQLNDEWRQIHGKDIPYHILRCGYDEVRRAALRGKL